MTTEPKMLELKPCPFCGGEAETWLEDEDDPDTECATCPDPDCVGSQINTSIDDWNNRAAQPVNQVMLEALKQLVGAIKTSGVNVWTAPYICNAEKAIALADQQAQDNNAENMEAGYGEH